MTGISEAIAAIAGIKTIADGLVAMRDETKVMETKLALMQQVFDIRMSLDGLQDEVAALKQANRALQEQNLQLQKQIDAVDEYDLIKLVGGVYVLAAKPLDNQPHKGPYFCQACHTNGKKSPLSFAESAFGRAQFPATLNCQLSESHQLKLPGGTMAKQIGYE